MSNRESFPISFVPAGDLECDPGATKVTVIGIQNVPTDRPASPTDDGKVATYVDADGRIEWKTGGGGGGSGNVVQVNGVGVSSDYLVLVNTAFAINYDSDDFLGVRVNGV
jgi:hypothetical protein